MVNKDTLFDMIQKYGELRRSQGAWEILNDGIDDPYHRDEKTKQEADEMYDKIRNYVETGEPDAVQFC